MGIAQCGNFLYKSKPLDLTGLHKVLEHRRKIKKDIAAHRRPAVDIDASEVGFKYISKSAGPAAYVLGLAKGMAEAGIDVCIVGEGLYRHHSKRASVQRMCDRRRAHIQRVQTRSKLVSLLQSTDGPIDQELKAALEKQEKGLQSKEDRRLPNQYTDILESLVKAVKLALPSHGTISFVRDDSCQADALLRQK
jgi:hypothetical protein